MYIIDNWFIWQWMFNWVPWITLFFFIFIFQYIHEISYHIHPSYLGNKIVIWIWDKLQLMKSHNRLKRFFENAVFLHLKSGDIHWNIRTNNKKEFNYFHVKKLTFLFLLSIVFRFTWNEIMQNTADMNIWVTIVHHWKNVVFDIFNQ